MANFEVVKSFESSYNLNEEVPDLLLCPPLVLPFFLSNNLQYVTAVGMLHHDAQTVGRIFKECLFVPNYVRVVNTGEDANFVKGVFSFFATELLQFNFFHGVGCVI